MAGSLDSGPSALSRRGFATSGDASDCDDDSESAARIAPPIQTGPARFQVTRGLIDQQLARTSALSTETFVMPGLDNAGKLSGFKLGSIRPDNVLYRLGLRNGDVLVAVNGKSLIHDTALEDLLALRRSSQVKPTIRRKGVQRELIYDIAQK